MKHTFGSDFLISISDGRTVIFLYQFWIPEQAQRNKSSLILVSCSPYLYWIPQKILAA
jgi:hypothetical protein